jgi:hypothetical protein
MRPSLIPSLARLIGPIELVLLGVLLFIPDRATALLITDLGVGVLIALALGVHLAFWRRWRGKGSTTEGEK